MLGIYNIESEAYGRIGDDNDAEIDDGGGMRRRTKKKKKKKKKKDDPFSNRYQNNLPLIPIAKIHARYYYLYYYYIYYIKLS